MIRVVKRLLELRNLKHRRCLLIGNQLLSKHFAFGLICFGMIKGNVVRSHDAVLRFSTLGECQGVQVGS